MRQLNQLTPLGIAYPMEKYPNPVITSREIIHTLMFLDGLPDGERPDLANIEQVIAQLETLGHQNVIGWIRGNPDEYIRGLVDGFEVKRYRVWLEFEDKSRLVFRESEDIEEIKKFAADTQNGYKRAGFTLLTREDKGVEVGRYQQKDDGTKEWRHFSIFRVSVIPARKYTPVEGENRQRFPSATDRQLQAQQG